MQSQKKVGEWPGAQGEEEVCIKPLSVQVPDVHEAMRAAGAKDAPKRPRKRLICCCGSRGCGIGPMTNVEDDARGGSNG